LRERKIPRQKSRKINNKKFNHNKTRDEVLSPWNRERTQTVACNTVKDCIAQQAQKTHKHGQDIAVSLSRQSEAHKRAIC
jgi:hypothetical protein